MSILVLVLVLACPVLVKFTDSLYNAQRKVAEIQRTESTAAGNMTFSVTGALDAQTTAH